MDPGRRRHPAARAAPAKAAAVALVAAAVAGCASSPSQAVRTTHAVPAPSSPAQQAQVYVYPAGGQDERQLDRDRYECHRWAVRQSGFDPSLPGLPPERRVQVVRAGPPPGAGVAAGAVTGAVLGAAVSEPWDRDEGALVGAAAGAVIGAIAEGSQARQVESLGTRQRAADIAEQERQAGEYRRAISACLEGRGYSVR